MLSFKYRHIIAISGHKVHIDKFGFKNMIKYWQDGSLLKVLAAKPDGPEFDSQDPHSKGRKTALNSCPVTYISGTMRVYPPSLKQYTK